ncbi:MAG: hypothetical protein ACOX2O_03680 [Bdellovibrionota bacterium]|jgi:hypothetical protein
MRITINGIENEFKTDSLVRFTDLIELIKTTIDPEHMITDLILDGRELTDSDWASPMSQIEGRDLVISTGTPSDFVNSRFCIAAPVLRECYIKFRNARKDFQSGKMQGGNQILSEAVHTLQAFFQWYASIVELIPDSEKERYNIDKQVSDISDICKKICQHQLYQSWWALGEVIKNELEPKIDELEDFCRTFEN